MEWGRFLMTVGSIFASAGLTMLLALKYVFERPVPDAIMTSFGLGLGVVILGGLIIYAIPKEKKE